MLNWLKKKAAVPNGPDFSSVTSAEQAEELSGQGVLARLMLMPDGFGGEDVPHNIVYVPGWVAEAKARVDQDVVQPLAAEGKVRTYSAVPEYEGESFVPVAIRVEASDPGSFITTIAIWGRALDRT